MPLENATTIAGLDASWPLSVDSIKQGDDQIRLLKKVLKEQFPGAGGSGFSTPIIATEDELNRVSGATSNLQVQIDNLVTSSGSDALNAPMDTILIFGLSYAPPGWVARTLASDYMLRLVDPSIHDPSVQGIDSPVNYSGGHTHTFNSREVQSGSGEIVVDNVMFQINGADWHPRYLDVIVGQKT